MKYLTLLTAVLGLAATVVCAIALFSPGLPGPAAPAKATSPANTAPIPAGPVDQLIGRLDNLKVPRVSFGGPHSAVLPNDATRAIVAEGARAVGPLVGYLDRASYSGAVYAVYCLRELRATKARSAIERLQRALLARERFEDAPHDATLEVQIDFFLRDAAGW